MTRRCEPDRRPPAQAGFSLVEMMVAVTILATLASMALPLTHIAATREREQTLRRNLWQIREAIDRYKKAVDSGRIAATLNDTGYPPNLATLVQGVPDRLAPQGTKLYFMRSIPRDPFCDCPDQDNAATWGLRSYASPPDHPAPGKDVYDVHSLSTAIGLDGVPYHDW